MDDAFEEYEAHVRKKAREAENLKEKNRIVAILAERAEAKPKAPLPRNDALNFGFEFAQSVGPTGARRYGPLDDDDFSVLSSAEEGLAEREANRPEDEHHIPPDYYGALLDDGLDITEEEFEFIYATKALKNAPHEMSGKFDASLFSSLAYFYQKSKLRNLL